MTLLFYQPMLTGMQRPRKYLTLKYSCIPLNSHSTTALVSSTTSSTTTTTSSTTSSTKHESSTENKLIKVEKLETELFNKLDSIDVINENVTDYVNEFFEQAINNIPSASSGSLVTQTSLLNITEKISKKLLSLMDLQDDINSLEFETSQLKVKIVKKRVNIDDIGDAVTNWEARDKSISLPDQDELIHESGVDEGKEY